MNLTVSSSPHLRDSRTTRSIMLDVLIALLPALIASYFIFGPRALMVVAVTALSAVAFEFICNKIRKRPVSVGDLSALVTGVLLAYCLPANVPYWIAIFGSLVAIVVVKQLFGGLGHNFANPAITARVVLLLSFSAAMTSFSADKSYAAAGAKKLTGDLMTSATPLGLLKDGSFLPKTMDLFLGKHAGSIGEVCAAALLLGLIYLLIRRVISPIIPCAYVGSFALIALLTNRNVPFHVLTGGLLLGAIFMATDYVTSPMTAKGKLIFGLGCGILTALIRFYGNMPEGVSYAILVMNLFTPVIDKYTKKIPVGGVKHA